MFTKTVNRFQKNKLHFGRRNFFSYQGLLIQQALGWREEWREEDVNHEASFADTVAFVQFGGERLEQQSSKI
jgi:hypothetical protein